MKYFLMDTSELHGRRLVTGLANIDGPRFRRNYELGDAKICSKCKERAFAQPILSYKKIGIRGRRLGDIMLNSRSVLVSSRFHSAWENSALTGLAFSQCLPDIFPSTRIGREAREIGFHLARPAEIITHFEKSSCAQYLEPEDGKEPSCQTCMSNFVVRLGSVSFPEELGPLPDFFCVSCLPGRILVSESFIEFVIDSGLVNFFFAAGYSYLGSKLIDGTPMFIYDFKDYLYQTPKGELVEYPSLKSSELKALHEKYWA